MRKFLITFLFAVAIFPSSVFAIGNYDGFGDKITLSSKKHHYEVGDEIKLTIDFHYKGGYKMRIFKDLAKSASLHALVWQGAEYSQYLNYPGKEFLLQTRKSGVYMQEPFDEFHSNKPQTVRRHITGRVKRKGDKIIVTFDGFGSFFLNESKMLSISMTFMPVQPHELNSLEDRTNYLSIRFG